MEIHDDGVTVTIIMTTDDYFALEAIAGENNESISWTTWQAIRQYIERAENTAAAASGGSRVVALRTSKPARLASGGCDDTA